MSPSTSAQYAVCVGRADLLPSSSALDPAVGGAAVTFMTRSRLPSFGGSRFLPVENPISECLSVNSDLCAQEFACNRDRSGRNGAANEPVQEEPSPPFAPCKPRSCRSLLGTRSHTAPVLLCAFRMHAMGLEHVMLRCAVVPPVRVWRRAHV